MIERRLLLSPYLAVPVLALLFSWHGIQDIDILYHLATGREILAGGGLPQSNIFVDRPTPDFYPNAAWLFELVVYQLYSVGGFGAVIIAKFIAALLLFTVIVAISVELAAPNWWRMSSVLLVAWAIGFRLTERPHLISHLALALFVYSVLCARRGELRWLSWLPLVMLVWANCHVGFIFGYLYLALAAAGATLSAWSERPVGESVSLPQLLRRDPLLIALWRAAGVVFLVSFVNPSPWANYRSLWQLQFTKHLYPIAEYAQPQLALDAGYLLLLVLAGVTAAARRERRSLVDYFPAVFFAALALSSVRFIPDSALTLLPMVAGLVPSASIPNKSVPVVARRVLPLAAVLLWLLLAWLLKPAALLSDWPPPAPRELARGVSSFLMRHHPGGRLYNSMSVCGTGMLDLYPTYRLYQTSYIQVELPAILAAYQARQSAEEWTRFMAQEGFALVWIDTTRYPHDDQYFPPDQWALVYFDDLNALYLRRGQQNDGIIARYELRAAHPARFSMAGDAVTLPTDQIPEGEEELRRLLSYNPDSPLLNLLLGVNLGVLQGRAGEALTLYQRALHEGQRQFPEGWPLLTTVQLLEADLLLGIGRREEAIALYRHVVAAYPQHWDAGVKLARALALVGDRRGFDELLKTLRRAALQNPQSVLELSTLLRESEALAGAEELLRQGLQQYPDEMLLLNELGLVLGLRGRISEAITVLEDVVGKRPDLMQARQNLDYARQLQRGGGQR